MENNREKLYKGILRAYDDFIINRVRMGIPKITLKNFLDVFMPEDVRYLFYKEAEERGLCVVEGEYKMKQKENKERTKPNMNRDFIYTGQEFDELTQALQEAEPQYTRLFVEKPYLNYFETRCCANEKLRLDIDNKNVLEFCGVMVTNCNVERSKERVEIQLSEVLQELSDGGYIYCQETGEREVTLSFQHSCEIKLTEMQVRGAKWYKWVR